MKIVTFERVAGESLRVGALLRGGQVLDFCSEGLDVPLPATHLGWMDLDGDSLRAAAALHASALADGSLVESLRAQGALLESGAVRLVAPVPRPGKLICIGLNYLDHARESGMEPPEVPCVFSKFPTSVVGPEAHVCLPPETTQNDYEAELGVVIGKRAFRVPEAAAMEHVLGYLNINDFSARCFQFADGQWQRGKSPDTYAPMGPFLATTDEVPDPHQLRIRMRLNDETMQDSNTDQLIHRVPALVAFLSQTLTLEPGDVIATGTPPGVGFARKPPVWVEAGDVMEVEIEGLGVLRNPVRRIED